VAGGAEPQEGGVLARAWTTCPKVLITNAPMKRRVGQRGQWSEAVILPRFAVWTLSEAYVNF